MFGSVINKARPRFRRPFWIKRLEQPMKLRRWPEPSPLSMLLWKAGALGIPVGLCIGFVAMGFTEVLIATEGWPSGPSLAYGVALAGFGVVAFMAMISLMNWFTKRAEARHVLVDLETEAAAARD